MEDDCHPKPAGKILETVTSAVTLNRSSVGELTSPDGTTEDMRRTFSWATRRLAIVVLLEARDLQNNMVDAWWTGGIRSKGEDIMNSCNSGAGVAFFFVEEFYSRK